MLKISIKSSVISNCKSGAELKAIDIKDKGNYIKSNKKLQFHFQWRSVLGIKEEGQTHILTFREDGRVVVINPFQPSVAFHIETSANQMTGFYMKCHT